MKIKQKLIYSFAAALLAVLVYSFPREIGYYLLGAGDPPEIGNAEYLSVFLLTFWIGWGIYGLGYSDGKKDAISIE